MSGVFALPLIDPVAGPREFVAGDENALVRVARRVVLEGEHDQLPLVIYGPTGSGKTFLAEGLTEEWRQSDASARVKHQPEASARALHHPAKSHKSPTPVRSRETLRISGVDFARQYADACLTDSVADFHESFRTSGLILIDGVHTLVDKPRAARELCVLLDRCAAIGKIVVCTSLVPPAELAHGGLASRLSAGLVVPLALPAIDTRRHLLAMFARERSLPLAAELVDRLAERLPGALSPAPSPRDLQGALLQLESTSKLTGSPLDAKLVETLLRPVGQPPVDLKRIVAEVARRFGVTADELRSSSRRQTLVRARGVVILLARRLTNESLQSVGQSLGKRDHSTVHHAMEVAQEASRSDSALKQVIDELQAELTRPPRASRGTARSAAKKSRGARGG